MDPGRRDVGGAQQAHRHRGQHGQQRAPDRDVDGDHHLAGVDAPVAEVGREEILGVGADIGRVPDQVQRPDLGALPGPGQHGQHDRPAEVVGPARPRGGGARLQFGHCRGVVGNDHLAAPGCRGAVRARRRAAPKRARRRCARGFTPRASPSRRGTGWARPRSAGRDWTRGVISGPRAWHRCRPGPWPWRRRPCARRPRSSCAPWPAPTGGSAAAGHCWIRGSRRSCRCSSESPSRPGRSWHSRARRS
mmetsp:Transcript_26210/g.61833  ORF Transcript_26210/g.61833 Transcript_26210/m.61833 type:complete len:248 (+) Transcript_26210:749-1492(+)